MNAAQLRLALQEDSIQILNWRNQEGVRKWMYSSAAISEDRHKAWYDTMLNDESKQWLILDWNNEPQAVVYFYDINYVSRVSDWGFYPTPQAMQGISALIEYIALRHAFGSMGLRRLQCEVLSGNSGVLNLHKKSGFFVEGIRRAARLTERGIEDVYMLAMLKEEWDDQEASLVKRLKRLEPIQFISAN